LLDVDGVLADFVGPTLRELHRMGGPKMTPEDIKTWDLFCHIPVEWKDHLLAAWDAEGWCHSLPMLPGAAEGVQRLREADADIVFATSPLKTIYWVEERIAWLGEHFGAKRDDIIFTSRKELLVGGMLIEDKLSTALEWSKTHNRSTALWDRPWNQLPGLPWKVQRVSTWDGVLDTFWRARKAMHMPPYEPR
jgi:5'(3')-deoxyribonucleotidase